MPLSELILTVKTDKQSTFLLPVAKEIASISRAYIIS